MRTAPSQLDLTGTDTHSGFFARRRPLLISAFKGVPASVPRSMALFETSALAPSPAAVLRRGDQGRGAHPPASEASAGASDTLPYHPATASLQTELKGTAPFILCFAGARQLLAADLVAAQLEGA